MLMPCHQKNWQILTGHIHRCPIRQIQSKYCPTHSLNTAQVMMRLCFQMEMLAALKTSHIIFGDIIDSVQIMRSATTPSQESEARKAGRFQMWAIRHCILPIYRYYSQQETILCDVPDIINEARYKYGKPRKGTINSLTDYEALTFLNFGKYELVCIYDCFGFNHQQYVTCHDVKCYLFSDEELFIFGLMKLLMGLDNFKLCHLVFGGSPRRWSCRYRFFFPFPFV